MNHFNLMIVDDEPVIRNGLANYIDWERLNCRIVYVAKDGLDAFENIEKYAPDIVITDLRMPELDGISLAKHIYENHKEICVIILSGYSDFSYAQQGMRYGVINYLLKPVSEQLLYDTVEKACGIIESNRNNHVYIQELEKINNENAELILTQSLRDIFLNTLSDTPAEYDTFYRNNVFPCSYLVIVFEIIHNDSVDYSVKNVLRKSTVITNMITLIFKNIKHIAVYTHHDSIAVLAQFDVNSNPETSKELIVDALSGLDTIKKLVPYSLVIGISSVYDSPSSLSEAYIEAEETMLMKKHDSENELKKDRKDETPYIYHKYIEQIMEQIKTANADKSVHLTNDLFYKFAADKIHPTTVKDNLILLCSLCSQQLGLYSLSLGDLLDQKNKDIYSKIILSKDIMSLKSLAVEFVKASAALINQSNSSAGDLVLSAQKFIAENYMKSISLSDIASHLHVNASYLSRLYKRKIGITVTDELSRMRIEKAKKLLTETDFLTYEIANKIGINDPVYFSQLFRKHTGVNPKEYRRIHYNN